MKIIIQKNANIINNKYINKIETNDIKNKKLVYNTHTHETRYKIYNIQNTKQTMKLEPKSTQFIEILLLLIIN